MSNSIPLAILFGLVVACTPENFRRVTVPTQLPDVDVSVTGDGVKHQLFAPFCVDKVTAPAQVNQLIAAAIRGNLTEGLTPEVFVFKPTRDVPDLSEVDKPPHQQQVVSMEIDPRQRDSLVRVTFQGKYIKIYCARQVSPNKFVFDWFYEHRFARP